uniref:Cytochrome P450 2J6-like isoform X3 n=1 Tax=Pogona vitticeps TaxID=103695 RepID=A0A6J0UMX2_9SAUR
MAIFSWLLVLSIILYYFWKRGRPKDFPPGPRPLPFFGNVFQMGFRNPLKYLQKMGKQYGPVMTFHAGQTTMLLIRDVTLAKEVLLTKGTEFAGRPENPITDFTSKKKGIIMAPYGQAWKEQRRFSLMVLRNFGLGKKSMEERILAEVAHLIQAFTENMRAPFDPLCFIDRAVTNIISSIVFGKRFEYEDATLRNVLDLLHLNLKLSTGPWALLYNEVPLLRRLPLPHKTIFENVQKVFAFFTKELDEHKATFVPGEHRDFIDAYLDELQKPEKKGLSFDDENLLIVVSDLFLAGSETTARTLQWGLLYMMAYPEIQEKCQQEMDAVLGNNACLKCDDRERLPYTNAVIHEILRFSSVVPLGLAHAPIKDMQLSGYVIPKGTAVVINIHAINHDESLWKSPNKFDPSNFLNEKGEFVKPEAFLAFSAGPRVCLGENLARMELFLFFTSMLRNFQVSWPDESSAPDCTPQFGGVMAPSPFMMSLKQRQQK